MYTSEHLLRGVAKHSQRIFSHEDIYQDIAAKLVPGEPLLVVEQKPRTDSHGGLLPGVLNKKYLGIVNQELAFTLEDDFILHIPINPYIINGQFVEGQPRILLLNHEYNKPLEFDFNRSCTTPSSGVNFSASKTLLAYVGAEEAERAYANNHQFDGLGTDIDYTEFDDDFSKMKRREYLGEYVHALEKLGAEKFIPEEIR